MLNPRITIDMGPANRALKEYAKVSSRELPELINQSSYNITTTAVAITKKADKSEIKRYLMSQSDISDAPIAAIIVNSAVGLQHRVIRGYRPGGIGLYGADMKNAVADYVRQQMDAVNFLRAGWLSAVAILARAIRKAPGANAVKFLARFGTHWGGATPARRGNRMFASFYNEAFSRWTSTENGYKYAKEGLERATSQEASRIAGRIATHLQRRADQLFMRFLR